MAEHEMAWSGLIEIAEGNDLLTRVRDAFMQFIVDFDDDIERDPLLEQSFMGMAVTLQGKIERAARAHMPLPTEEKVD